NIDPLIRNRMAQSSLHVTHELDNATFKSITAYSDIAIDQNQDTDVTPVSVFNAFINMGTETVTQEFQLLSPDSSDVKWVLGAFYLNDKSTNSSLFTGSLFAP